MKKLLGSPFVLDQALNSIITFVLVAAIARSGGVSLVGAVAILQTIALTGLAGSRAIGIDVWAAAGGTAQERRDALGPSVLVGLGVFIINTVPWLLLGGGSSPLTIYWLASPAIVLMDAVRILLLHANKTWISIAVNSFIIIALLIAIMNSFPASIILGIYLSGLVAAIVLGLVGLKIRPPFPSLKYSLRNRSRSGPFLIEISLGSIMQQALFMLLALLSSVEAAGQIRIAQTLLGPMAVIHAGLSPQLLRRLAQIPTASRRRIALAGQNFGLLLACISLLGAFALAFTMPLEVAGRSILEVVTGQTDPIVPQILAMCGVTLASGAIILGTGTAARILGLTSELNKWRLVLVLPQVTTVAIASSTGSVLAATGGLALASVATAIASIFIVLRNVGRRGRRAKPPGPV